MNQQITVKRPGEFEYQIVWGNDFSALGENINRLGLIGRKVCIVTDSNVDALYAEAVTSKLVDDFELVSKFVMPAGEVYKTLDTVRDLYTHLIEHRFERKDILIALGGGVVGDLTGFAAATYLRGIDFIQIPTTLLAQVDSSVGGKTGVDFDNFKNMVGAFWQPRLVYMNTTVLDTLSEELFACGIGEILKTGLLKDADYFNSVITNKETILSRDKATLTAMIKTSCQIKATIVENDPTEQGERALLNLGHTLGHAIEKLMGFTMLHGQCVALGTLAAAYLSYFKGYLTMADVKRIEDANMAYNLPTKVKGLAADEILAASKSDKKMEQGKIKFVLLSAIGSAFVDKSVTDKELKVAIDYIIEE
jgi:3-dehydroquinate synthase